jgi:TRAP-type uncharacterized transport system substrate-binding protein
MNQNALPAIQNSKRRSFLKAAGSVGVVSLAGCSTDESDDSNLIYTTHESVSVVYSASQALAATINENTDVVNLEVRPSDGGVQNAGRLANREAHLGWMDIWSLGEIIEGIEPYDEINIEPLQILNIYTLPWMFLSGNPEVTDIGDIQSDHQCFIGPAGQGDRRMLEYSFDQYLDDYQIREIAYGDQGGAFSEERLDVGKVAKVNYAFEPGWGQELKATADVGFMTWPDNAERLRNDDRVLITDVDMTDIEGYDLFEHPHRDAITGLTMSYNIISHQEVPYDPVYNFLEAIFDNSEAAGERHALLTFYENLEYWVENMHSDTKFHPAAADFYQEHDVWNNDWDVGEIDE